MGTHMGRSLIVWLLITVMTSSTSMIGGSFSFRFRLAVAEAFCCSPPASNTRTTTPTSGSSTPTARTITATTKLSLAFFLPDEDRQIRQDDDEPNNTVTKEENGDSVLDALMDKLDKNQKDDEITTAAPPQKKDNKSMAFLKRMGRVGGAANKNFVNAVGSDEGSTGRQPPAERGAAPMGKSRASFFQCTASGVVDDLSEPFPNTSSGAAWRGVTDRVAVPGGSSNGSLRREPDLHGRTANVLAGRVSRPRVPPAGHGDHGDDDSSDGRTEGFLQMVTDLPLDPSQDAVDASDYDGIELDVLYRGSGTAGNGSGPSPSPAAAAASKSKENVFHIHVRTPGTLRQASYRHTFALERADAWETVRVPFSGLRQRTSAAKDDGNNDRTLDPSAIKRIGIVAIGQEMDVFLAMSGLRFYSVF